MTEHSFAFKNNLFMRQAKELDRFAYSGDDLGVSFEGGKVFFKVWAPTADNAELKLYTTGSDDEPNAFVRGIYPMTHSAVDGVWLTSLPAKEAEGLYYTYLFTFGKQVNESVDIYARSAGVNGRRGMVIDLSKTNPEGWDEDRRVFCAPSTQAVIWEVHIKDFSFSPSSGVDERYRGKFLAFTQSGTTVNARPDSPSTCLDYLKRLGVTHIQINPMFDFATVDEAAPDGEQYNWGYDPLNYNVPEGSYATNPYDGAVRVRECKQMIQALHSAGIGVIMDVVYNHTYHSTDSYFNLTVPNYYYRMNSDGSFSNGSGCGCDTASERVMFRKYMIDSVIYWAEEYHLDGFRFDLMGLHDVETINEIRRGLDKLENGKNILMYGEGWDMATTVYPGTQMATKRNLGLLNDRVAVFNDNIRDALKGNAFEAGAQGFIQHGYCENGIVTGIEGQSNRFYGWAQAPTQTINYASCHDNFTLYDKLVASCRHNGEYKLRHEELVSMNKLCAAVLLTSQGIPFFLAGEEFCRSKSGDHNSYRSSPYLNMIDWRNLFEYADVVDYYRRLIKIRKQFRPFTDETNSSANAVKFIENTPQGVVGYTLKNNIDKNGWQNVCVIFNGNPASAEVQIKGDELPNEWVIIGNHDSVGFELLGKVNDGRVNLAPNSAMLLVGFR